MLNFFSNKIKLLLCKKTEREFFLYIYSLIGIAPKNIDIYKEALTHKSAYAKNHKGEFICNERLEYLGDSVIETSISKYLYDKYPNEKEGFLTKMRSKIVNRKSLNSIGYKIKLDKYMIIGTLYHDSINGTGNALEALIGAIFLDLGYKTADDFILNTLLRYIDFNFLETVDTNYKSKLIEIIQHGHGTISFETNEAISDEQQKQNFVCVITINGTRFCEGTGKNKKEADQNASQTALNMLHNRALI